MTQGFNNYDSGHIVLKCGRAEAGASFPEFNDLYIWENKSSFGRTELLNSIPIRMLLNTYLAITDIAESFSERYIIDMWFLVLKSLHSLGEN